MSKCFKLGVIIVVSLIFAIQLLGCGGGGGGGGEVSSNPLSPATSTGGTIRGVVNFSTTASVLGQKASLKGSVAEGADVFLESDPQIKTTTDAQGNYELQNVPEGKHRVIAKQLRDGKEYKMRSDELTVVINQIAIIQNIFILPAENSIQGRIFDYWGKPLSGVTIKVWDQTSTSDANGDYQVFGMPKGSWEVKYSKSLYNDYSAILSFGSGQITKYDLVLSLTTSENTSPIVVSSDTANVGDFKIENVTVRNSDTEAWVSWNTTVETTSQVSFGSANSLSKSVINLGEYNTLHQAYLGNLSPSSNYVFSIVSISKNGRNVTHEATFTTSSSNQTLSGDWSDGAAPVSEINFAIGRPTKANSNEGGWNSSGNAVDGNQMSRWSSNRDDPGPDVNSPHTIIVDLEKNREVKSIRVNVKGFDSWLQDFSISTSLDMVNWTTIASETKKTGIFTYNFSKITMRYIKFDSTYSADNGQVNVYEIEAYGSEQTQIDAGSNETIETIIIPDPTQPPVANSENLALNCPVETNSNEMNMLGNGSAAVDGDSGTRWSSNRDDLGPDENNPHYLIVDLKSVVSVSKVRAQIESWDHHLQTFSVFVSTDKLSWTKIGGEIQKCGTFDYENTEVNIRYIKFESYYSSDNGQVNLYELSAIK